MQIRLRVGLLGEQVKYNNIIYLFIYTVFLGTRLQVWNGQWIFVLDGSNYADSHKAVPFKGFVHIAVHIRRHIFQAILQAHVIFPE